MEDQSSRPKVQAGVIPWEEVTLGKGGLPRVSRGPGQLPAQLRDEARGQEHGNEGRRLEPWTLFWKAGQERPGHLGHELHLL